MISKRERTREMALETSYSLFARDGFNKVTMKDVCDATGLSRGGLYSHFAGTKELFEAILEKINQKDEMDFYKEMEEGMSAVDILNRAIGSIALIPPAQSHTKVFADEIEVGYWIGVPFWGKGLIPEAVRKLQEHVFEDLGYAAMWCGYYDGNEKSKRCQEKCGFVYHHTEENKPCALMGDVRTEHFTRLTRKEWEASK